MEFPGSTYLDDGAESYRTSSQMAEFLREARVFLALDESYDQR
jgi:hypothetical protein